MYQRFVSLLKHHNLACIGYAQDVKLAPWGRERSVQFALLEASSFSREIVTVSDLLLGSLRADKPLLLNILGRAHLTEIVAEIESLEGQRRSVPTIRNHVLSQSAGRLLVTARSEARAHGSKRILGRHIIAALVMQEHAPFTRHLCEYGLTLDRLRT